MIIPTNPFLNNSNEKFENDALVFPWDRAFFSSNGSTAIILTLRDLGIKKGSKIGVPAYICNSVPNCLIKHGYIPIYFDIEINFIPKHETINKLIHKRKIKALILVEYFGLFNIKINRFIKDIKAKNNIKVILDRCHSSFSGDFKISQLSRIDALVYSHRKTLRVFDGGCHLILSKSKLTNFHEIINIPRLSLFYIFHFIENFFYYTRLLNIYSEPIYKIRKMLKYFYKRKYKHINFQEKSKISNNLFSVLSNKNEIQKIKDTRRANYNFLIKELSQFKNKKFEIIHKKLSINETPQILPLLDLKGDLVSFLRKHCISAYHWPDFELPHIIKENKIMYSNSNYYNKSLICIPVHQSLKLEHLKYIISIMSKW